MLFRSGVLGTPILSSAYWISSGNDGQLCQIPSSLPFVDFQMQKALVPKSPGFDLGLAPGHHFVGLIKVGLGGVQSDQENIGVGQHVAGIELVQSHSFGS